jgi:Ni/Co efflux regulator RcnB
MTRLLFASLAVLVLAPPPAGAQVYPERIVIKSKHASTASYQRRGRDDNREQQTERTTKTFRLGASGTLMLGNIAGDITVTRGSGSETSVEIVKTAHGRDAADARELLQLVTVDATERPDRVEVKAHYPGGDEMKRSNRRNLNVEVDYIVTAPAGIHLAVETISGDVKIADIKGEVTASSISGDVRITGGGRVGSAKSISGTVEITEANVDGALEASSVSGDVKLHHITARRIQSGSVSGNLELDEVQSERVTASTTSGTIVFGGTLAKNGRYELKGFSGDVRVRLAGATGFELDASTFSGQIRSDDFPITARGRMSGRHLTGTWGDGSAVLSLQTFSGSIVISKR